MTGPARIPRWAAALAGASLFAAIVGWAQTTTINLQDDQVVAQGEEIFRGSCAVGYCHGSGGRAGGAPQLGGRDWDVHRLFDVTWNGVPDTTMPAWSAMLNREDVWAVVAYIMSLSTTKLDVEEARVEIQASDAGAVELSETALRGRDLFFDLTRENRCGICHEVAGRGGDLGPDLSNEGHHTEEELLEAIREPSKVVEEDYRLVSVSTNEGEEITGIVAERGEGLIRIYDIAGVPPVLRTLYADQIEGESAREGSAMPDSAASVYSEEELGAIVVFLRGE